jgi:hypothetical protein
MSGTSELLDIVIPAKRSLVDFVVTHTLPRVIAYLPYRSIIVIVHKEEVGRLSDLAPDVLVVDEDELCPGLKLEGIKRILAQRGASPDRAGWYFQQFLKLGLAQTNLVSDYYLVWDADCLPLRPINNFTSGDKILLDKTQEYHAPYFETNQKLLGLNREVEFSFISEHMVFEKHIVNEILDKISLIVNDSWWEIIINNVSDQDLGKSGFSEYELYGNYLAKYHPAKFAVRKLHKTRKGTKLFGFDPPESGLKLLALSHDYISFEQWQDKIKSPIKRYSLVGKQFFKGLLSR